MAHAAAIVGRPDTQIERVKINLGTVFRRQYVGLREIADEAWRVSFMDYDPGFFGQDVNKVELVGENPFAPKLLPMSS